MLNKSNFSKLAQDIFHSKHALQGPQIMHPAREWFIGVFIGLGILGGCIFLSVQTYFEYRNVDLTVDSSNTNTATVYKTSLIEAALEYFNQKSTQHTQLRNTATGFVIFDEDTETPVAKEVEVGTASTTEAVPEASSEEDIISSSSTTETVSSSTVSGEGG